MKRLGESKTLRADARVIAATNRDAKTAMERGQFYSLLKKHGMTDAKR